MGAAKTAGGAGRRNSNNRKRFVTFGEEKKIVSPVWYHGSREGFGNYMAGHIDGKTVEDQNGKPIPFRQIGQLENS